MRALIIAGGRDYKPIQVHVDQLNKCVRELGIDKIVEGCATGADRYGQLYAEHYGLVHVKVSAQWDKFGRNAGFMRNMKMTMMPDVVAVFLFPGGVGTTSMYKIALKCGLKVYGINLQDIH